MKKVALHFDINKTIVLSDSSSGRDFLMSLHSLLSECCWGKYDANIPRSMRTAEDWVICSDVPSTSSPDPLNNAVTFGSYLEDHTDIPRGELKLLKSQFAASNGIGSRFAPYFQTLQDKLTIPSSDLQSSCLASPIKNLHHGFYYILPAFYHFFAYITSASRQQSMIDVRFILRTFGEDIQHVAQEWNAYCRYQHPLFSHPEHIDLSMYMIHLPESLMLLTRHDADQPMQNNSNNNSYGSSTISNSVIAVTSTPVNNLIYIHPETKLLTRALQADIWSTLLYDYLQFDKQPTNSSIGGERERGGDNVCRKIVAIRDDYVYWAAHHEADDGGKLLYIDPRTLQPPGSSGNSSRREDEDGEDSIIYQIFFDDNIERDRAHIVDARRWSSRRRSSGTRQPASAASVSAIVYDEEDGMSIPFEETKDKLLVKVEPYEAIMNEHYFIELLQEKLRWFGIIL